MLRQYNPKDTVVTINDSIALSGFSTSMITGAKDNPFASVVEGAQGDAVMNVSASSIGTLTITLQATSPSNNDMMNLARNREIFKIWCNDKSIGERMGGNEAFVENYPSIDKNDVVTDRVYTVKVADFTAERTN